MGAWHWRPTTGTTRHHPHRVTCAPPACQALRPATEPGLRRRTRAFPAPAALVTERLPRRAHVAALLRSRDLPPPPPPWPITPPPPPPPAWTITA